MNEIYQLKIVIHYIVECVENKVTKMINVNQNYYPMEVWIWNHTQNKKKENHITG